MGRRMCKGQYWKFVLVLLVCTLVVMLPPYIFSSFTDSVFILEIVSLATTALNLILSLGTVSYCLAVFRGERATADHVTSAFDNKWKAIGLELIVACRILVRTLLLIVPGIIEALRDALVLQVLSDHPEYDAADCLTESRRLMEGNCSKYAKLVLSFAGWALLASIPAIIHACVYGPALDSNLLATLSGTQMQEYLEAYELALLTYRSQLVPTLLTLFSLLVKAYMMMSAAAFYDIACGNLVVREEGSDLLENDLNLDIQDITDYRYKDK